MDTSKQRKLLGLFVVLAFCLGLAREMSTRARGADSAAPAATVAGSQSSSGTTAPSDATASADATPPATVAVPANALGITYALARFSSAGSSLKVPGTVSIPPSQVANVSPRVAGQVVEVRVRVGDRVRRGQTLATIRSLDIATAQGALAQAREQVHFAKLALAHQQQLAHLGSFSQKPVEDARSTYNTAQAALLADQSSSAQDVMTVRGDQSVVQQDTTQLKQDELDAANDKIIADRQMKLYQDGIAARQDYEAAKMTADKDQEKLAGDQLKIEADQVKVQSDQARVSGDQTHLKTDEIQARIARAALERELHVLSSDIYTAQTVETAQAAYDAARLQLEQARQALAIHGVPGAGAGGIVAIPAPIDGIITARNVNPGINVDNSTMTPWQMFTISDLSSVYVDGNVAAKDLARVRLGLPIAVQSQAYPGTVYAGHIIYITPNFDPATHTVKVRGLLGNPRGELKDGMYVDVSITTSAPRGVVLVPGAAVQSDAGGSFVWVPDGHGRCARRAVTIGQDVAGQTEILTGIAAGQKVVAAGALLLSNGTGGGDD